MRARRLVNSFLRRTVDAHLYFRSIYCAVVTAFDLAMAASVSVLRSHRRTLDVLRSRYVRHHLFEPQRVELTWTPKLTEVRLLATDCVWPSTHRVSRFASALAPVTACSRPTTLVSPSTHGLLTTLPPDRVSELRSTISICRRSSLAFLLFGRFPAFVSLALDGVTPTLI